MNPIESGQATLTLTLRMILGDKRGTKIGKENRQVADFQRLGDKTQLPWKGNFYDIS